MQRPEETSFVEEPNVPAARAAAVCGRKEKESPRTNQKRFDQINKATPETMAVGYPFCMAMMETRSNPGRWRTRC